MTERDANVRAAYYAATRLVWAELSRTAPDDERDAAMGDLWTGDEEADDERAGLLIEALAEYAAILARKAAPSRREAAYAAYEQVWAMVPDAEAADALARRTLKAGDALIARHLAS